MKTAKILGYLLLLVTSSIVGRSADAMPSVKVESSRAMKVAVINADHKNPANERMYKAFAASMGFEISQCYKTPIPVKMIEVDAQDASFGLSNGEYDLVAVIGASIPTILSNSDFKRLKAVPSTGNSKHVFNLLVRVEDSTLSDMLDTSFGKALNETFFQLAFANYRKSSNESDKTEWKVAVASLR